MEIKYLKSAARVLGRECTSKGGLDLSKEVLWVSVGQRSAKIQAVKFGDLKKILSFSPQRIKCGKPDLSPRRWEDLLS